MKLIREIRPDAITVAEDMSGMPGMCLPIEDGGIGFDFRLAMGVPDFWIKMLEQKDDDWPMESLYHELSTARHLEKRIAYVESHDQGPGRRQDPDLPNGRPGDVLAHEQGKREPWSSSGQSPCTR